MNPSGNQTQLTSLHASASNIVQAGRLRLHSRNKVIVLLTFANNNTFQFEILVIADIKENTVFGKNHLRKTDAATNFQGVAISFKDRSMNFQLNCIRREQRNFEQSRQSLAELNLGLCHKEKITNITFRSVLFFVQEGRTVARLYD